MLRFCVVIVASIQSILSQTINCHKAFSCANQFTQSPSNCKIINTGYKSAYNSSIVTQNRTICTGAFSCAKTHLFTATSIDCLGSHSCWNALNIKGMDSTKAIIASGVRSLSYATVSGLFSEVHCLGEQSCAYSTIYIDNNHTSVYGYGAYSLLYTVIDTRNTSGVLDIYLFGHNAGFGANITCRTGTNCTIYCAATACIYLHLNCHQNCVVDTASNDTITNITFNATQYKYKPIQDPLFNNNISQRNDIACSTQSDSVRWDELDEGFSYDNQDIEGNANKSGPVCCRAAGACLYHSINYSLVIGQSIICSGEFSCRTYNIINNGPVYCEGYDSCAHTPIITSGNVHCSGYYSCYYTDIQQSSYIYCSGDNACSRSEITSSGADTNIYFLGYLSGDATTILCSSTDHCHIFCKGAFSCRSLTVTCDGTCSLDCAEDSYCPDVPTTNPTLYPSQSPVMLPSDFSNVTSNMSATDGFSIAHQSTMLVPFYKRTHNAIILEEASAIINITLNVNNVSLDEVIQTVNDTITFYLIANAISTSFVTDVISRFDGNTVIIEFVLSDELETAQINTTKIEQSLNDNFPDDNVVVNRVDVVYKQKDKTENKSDLIDTYVFILVLSSAIMFVLLVIVYKCYMKTQKHHQDQITKNIEQKVGDLSINNMNALDHETKDNALIVTNLETQDITPMGLHKRANNDALEVQYWLQHIVELPQYFKTFMDSGYEAMSFIQYIPNMVELSEIGVESKVHQMRLWEEIKKLKGEDVEPHVAENKKREGSIWNDDAQKHHNETHETTQMSSNQYETNTSK